MKKILTILTAIICCITLSSCITSGLYDIADDNTVVIYGTPYYSPSGVLMYYRYNGRYYYPHHSNYIHYRPIPRIHHHNNPPQHHATPRPHTRTTPSQRPNIHQNRGKR